MARILDGSVKILKRTFQNFKRHWLSSSLFLLFYVCFSFGIGCICCIDIESLIQNVKILYATVFVVIHGADH
jgi:hypothetical protein